jgi:hypothetical protein
MENFIGGTKSQLRRLVLALIGNKETKFFKVAPLQPWWLIAIRNTYMLLLSCAE